MATLETLTPIGRSVLDERGTVEMWTSRGTAAARFYNGDGLTVIEQLL